MMQGPVRLASLHHQPPTHQPRCDCLNQPLLVGDSCIVQHRLLALSLACGLR